MTLRAINSVPTAVLGLIAMNMGLTVKIRIKRTEKCFKYGESNEYQGRRKTYFSFDGKNYTYKY